MQNGTFRSSHLRCWKISRLRLLILLASSLFPAASLQAKDTQVDYSALASLESFKECDVCPEMIVMPQGSFMMGAIPGESRNPFDAYGKNPTFRRRKPGEINVIPHEHPRHQVEMDIRFAIGRNEVTHGEWMQCVEAGDCTHEPEHGVLTLSGYKPLGPNHPVVNVSYLDTLEYVAWLNRLVGRKVYRLPTEAEWEYAARAGAKTRFAQGDELNIEQANFSRRSTEHLRGEGVALTEFVNREKPVPVYDLNAANAWDLRHTSGNVYELTLSCWSNEHLNLSADSVYLEHASRHQSCDRVAKGGAYSTAMDGLRPASRKRPKETFRSETVGFRIVRILKKE